MKQVFLGGPAGVHVEDIPAPAPGPGEVLVRVARSLISTGTEGAGVTSSQAKARSPLERIADDPSLLLKAARKAVTDGLGATAQAAAGTGPRDLTPLGYSTAGVVIAVGDDVRRFSVGDRVACAGGGYAVHAEFNVVPENLVVRVPDAVAWDDAAFVTLGAIAMQGVRRAGIGLGERVGIIGLGLLGQLGVQISAAAGCRVLALDLDRERVDLARSLGAADAGVSSERDPVAMAMEFSDDVGLDAVLIYAGTSSSELVNTAFEMTRERGRVVVIGAVGMDLERKTFYNREQDLLISRSYGPGRYDSSYEEDGRDYPIAYVRWTENRNMVEFLALVADGKVATGPLVSATFEVERAEEAYAHALAARGPAVASLLSYASAEETPSRATRFASAPATTTAPAAGVVQFGLIGAGGFAKSVLIPNIGRIPGASLRGVVSQHGHSATSAAKRGGAAYASTDPEELFGDAEVDAVVITTRHDSHAPLAIAAARAGKHVFVEKPLAMTREECRDVALAVAETGVLLTVGFNRRYSPHVQLARTLLATRRGPKLMTYRANAGFKALDHWVYDPVQGGGRILGEACHFFDLLTYLAGAEPVRVFASGLSQAGPRLSAEDNLAVTLEFADGSVGQVLYAGNGDTGFPKERIEVFCDTTALAIDDFRTTTVAGYGTAKGLVTKDADKGHLACLQAFVDAVGGRAPLEMGVADGVRATLVALEALASFAEGAPRSIDLSAVLPE